MGRKTFYLKGTRKNSEGRGILSRKNGGFVVGSGRFGSDCERWKTERKARRLFP
jgi:hypothetical protein